MKLTLQILINVHILHTHGSIPLECIVIYIVHIIINYKTLYALFFFKLENFMEAILGNIKVYNRVSEFYC